MRLHERSLLVATGRNEISTHVVSVWSKLHLTPLEVVSILASLTAEYMKYPLRHERHPDNPDKRADEA